MRGFYFVFTLFGLMVFLNPSLVLAEILELYVQESIDVYKEADGKKKISQLGRGDRVIISPRIYGNFRKVLITYRGKKRSGYIAQTDIIRSTIQPQSEKFRDQRVYKNRGAIGLGATFSFLGSLGRDLQRRSNNDDYRAKGSQGLGSQISLFGHYPLAPRHTFSVSLSQLSVTFKGQAHSKEAPEASKDIEISEDWLGLKGNLKIYSHLNGLFWYGPHLALFLLTPRDFHIEGLDIGVEDKHKESQFFSTLGMGWGWDIPIGDSFYLIPEFSLDVSVLKKPMSFGGGVGMKVAWAF